MQHRRVLGLVIPLAGIVFVGLLATMAWAHGMGGHGGFHGRGGFPGGLGGFPGGVTHPGFHGGFGRPRVQGFGPFAHFQHELFLGPHRHFGGFPGGVRGFHRGLFFGNRFGPVGPPFGVAGPSPFFPTRPPAAVIRSPFFCFPHRLGFADQALFTDHLFQAHGIPPRRALSFCTSVGSRCFFFDGFQRNFFFGSPVVVPGPATVVPLGSPVAAPPASFFCAPHGLGFIDQALFLDHLRRVHGIPLGSALSFCRVEGSRLLFPGF